MADANDPRFAIEVNGSPLGARDNLPAQPARDTWTMHSLDMAPSGLEALSSSASAWQPVPSSAGDWHPRPPDVRGAVRTLLGLLGVFWLAEKLEGARSLPSAADRPPLPEVTPQRG